MDEQATKHKVSHMFEVEIERTDEEQDGQRCYQACCRELTGCRVYASSKHKALRKIREAKGDWLDLADRQLDSVERADR